MKAAQKSEKPTRKRAKAPETEHLYSGVNIVDVWDAAKYGLEFFLGQNGSSNLPLFL